MNINYMNVSTTDTSINSLNLTVAYDGYEHDGYHLTVSDGYITISMITYHIPETEIVIPIPFPHLVSCYLCLDLTNNAAPCILMDEIGINQPPYRFSDGHYKLLEVLFRATNQNLVNQSIMVKRIVVQGS